MLRKLSERAPGARVRWALLAAWAAGAAAADVKLHGLFNDHMVLQRNRPVPVWGTASPGERGEVAFAGQRLPFTADSRGDWRVDLAPLAASAAPRDLEITGARPAGGAVVRDVLVGDVWLCSGQSNMDWSLQSSQRPADVAAADLPALRHIRIPLRNAGLPQRDVSAPWSVCTPATAGGFSAVAFYFGRRILQETGGSVPIGLLVSSVGGTQIDPWLAPEGLAEHPALQPLFSRPVLPFGPFSLFNGMIHPLAPFALFGAIWYQGESFEGSSQGPDSYHLKMRALAAGWSRLFGVADFPFYYVQIANYTAPAAGPAPEAPGGWAEIRLQQANSLSIPHSGMAVTLDVGEAGDIHPKDKQDVGERLALWALRNDYGRAALVPGGPVLRDITVSGGKLACAFDYAGSGLMAGQKTFYLPTRETPGVALQRFSIAGADGVWHAAEAVPQGGAVILSSPSVPAPRKAAYAYWQNPEGANLYNREGLPASPFFFPDVLKRHTLTASAGQGGSIRPSGTRSLLERQTALYAITPEPGRYIADVAVDGKSVGAVAAYAFDPVYGDHAIAATFTGVRPVYALRARAAAGATLSPSGDATAAQGESRMFTAGAGPGCEVELTVDGLKLGPRRGYTFSDIRRDHAIEAVAVCPITAVAGFGGTVTPAGIAATPFGSSPDYVLTPAPGYAIADLKLDGKSLGALGRYTLPAVGTGHVLVASFSPTTPRGGTIPRPDKILFAAQAADLPAAGSTAWPLLYPAGKSLSPLGSPVTAAWDGRKYAVHEHVDGDGWLFGAFSAPIPCEGATIVAVARPRRIGAGSDWEWISVVNVFHDRLGIGIRNASGTVCVLRNGLVKDSPSAVPDGQVTLLSLVVQPGGAYRAYANGQLVLEEASASPMTTLTPGVPGAFADRVIVGRATDNWSAFNGDIGDVFLYRTALGDAERKQLEGYLEERLAGGNVVAVPARRPAAPGGKARTEAVRRSVDGRLREPAGRAPAWRAPRMR